MKSLLFTKTNMASIDKIYCDWKEYQELKKFLSSLGKTWYCERDTWKTDSNVKVSFIKPSSLLFDWSRADFEEVESKKLPVLAITDEAFEFFLLRKCPIESVRNRIKEQYGIN